MSQRNYPKILAATAQDVLARISSKLTDDARALFASAQPPADVLEQAVERGLLIDAIYFLAAALPKRVAVWWACICARDALPPDTPPPVIAALQAAEAWVYRPTEENRRAAEKAAKEAKLERPGGWAAQAVFWSGGSMTAPDAPAVEPDPRLMPAAVAGGIRIAAVQFEPQKAEERYRDFLANGLDIAAGGTGRKPVKEA